MELSFLSLLEGSLLPDPSEPAAGPAFCPGISSAGPAELRACPGRPCGQPSGALAASLAVRPASAGCLAPGQRHAILMWWLSSPGC